MNWFTSAIIAILFLSFYNFILKVASSKISSIHALPFIAGGVFVASLIGLTLSKVSSLNNLQYTKHGALYAVFAGLFWGLGIIFAVLMYSKNTPLSIGLPLITGGLAIIGSILGILFLKEPVTALKVFGVVVTLVGLIILSKA